jgi:hypothetical protein
MKDRIYGHDLRADRLIESGRVVKLEDGRTVFKDFAGQEIDLNKGIESFLQLPENKEDLKNTAAPGAGTGGQGGGSSVRKLSRADFDGLAPQARADFLLKEKGEIV